MQDIFLFERTGLTPDGRVQGVFRATGIRPKCAQQLAQAGFTMAPELFEHRMVGGVGGAPWLSPLATFVVCRWPSILGAYWAFCRPARRAAEPRGSPAACRRFDGQDRQHRPSKRRRSGCSAVPLLEALLQQPAAD